MFLPSAQSVKMGPQQGQSTESTRPLRPLLPAAAPRCDVPPLQSKRARVSLACAACRMRKTKCDGERPRCCECTARESACQYTETESTQTKRRRADVEELFELLRTLPEESAFELLARIRAGADTRELVETMQYGNLLVQFASASTAGSQDSQDNQQCSGGSST